MLKSEVREEEGVQVHRCQGETKCGTLKGLGLRAWSASRVALEADCTGRQCRGPREKWEGNTWGEEQVADHGGGSSQGKGLTLILTQ